MSSEDKAEQQHRNTNQELVRLEEQRSKLASLYADVSLQLRGLEMRERELGATLRLMAEQIQLAQQADQESKPEQPPPLPST